jgi:hypothetical protein
MKYFTIQSNELQLNIMQETAQLREEKISLTSFSTGKF